jgi:hypothetical protein
MCKEGSQAYDELRMAYNRLQATLASKEAQIASLEAELEAERMTQHEGALLAAGA